MPALTHDNLLISQLLHQRCELGMTVAARRSLMPASVCVCVLLLLGWEMCEEKKSRKTLEKWRVQRGSVVALNVNMVVMQSQADHIPQFYTGCLPVKKTAKPMNFSSNLALRHK